MNNDLTPDAARAALGSAATTRDGVHAHARWMPTYMVTFGIGFGAAALLLGMIESFWWRMGLFLGIWLAFVLLMVRWAARRPASVRTSLRRTAPWWIGTGAFYGIALFVGTGRFQGELAYWAPAAVLIALPLVVGGLRERRA